VVKICGWGGAGVMLSITDQLREVVRAYAQNMPELQGDHLFDVACTHTPYASPAPFAISSCFVCGAGAVATFETDALKITLPFGTLLRSAAGAATSFACRHHRVHVHCTHCKHTMLVASSQCLSGPDMLFLIVEAVVVQEQFSITITLRHQIRHARDVSLTA
jgi:hypothetical protein